MSQSKLVNPSFFETAKHVSFDEGCKARLNWFLPLTSIEDRWRAEVFVNEWLVFGAHLAYFDLEWQSRIEWLLFYHSETNEYNARVVASMFRWFGTSVGGSFLHGLLKEIADKKFQKKLEDRDKSRKALAHWEAFSSFAASGRHHAGHHLNYILRHNQPNAKCTFSELSTAQNVIVFISHGEGLEFVRKVLNKIAAREKAESNKMCKAMGIKVRN